MIKNAFSRLIQWVKRGKVILAEATFYNDDADCIVLTQTYKDGHKRHTLFCATANLVNHCQSKGINITKVNTI